MAASTAMTLLVGTAHTGQPKPITTVDTAGHSHNQGVTADRTAVCPVPTPPQGHQQHQLLVSARHSKQSQHATPATQTTFAV